jgi:peptidoglycan/LPS O-acetylase OafA/YrhL
MAWVSLFRTEFASLGTHIIASVGFFNNIHLYQSLDYFSDMAIQQPLLHLWSLGIEEQFYMVWPLLIGLLVRHPRWQSGILAGIVMLSLTINIIDIQFHPEATFYLLPSRLWQLAAGGILAHVGYGQQASPLSTTQANLLAYGAIAIIAVCVGLYHHALNYPGWYALLPTLAAVGLIAAGSHTWVNRTVLSHPVAVWVGLISYPLYLWHWPVLSFATFLAEFWLTPTVKIGLLLVSMALAAATYYLVERPIRFGRFKHLSAWVILTVFVGIGAVGWLMQSRTITVLAKPDIQNARERYQSVCGGWLGNTALPLAGTCYAYQPDIPAIRRHIVIGDSHARAYTAGLVEADPQAAVFGYASDGCMPIRNFERFDNTSSQAYGCSNPLLLESALQIVQQAVHTTDLPTTIYVVGRYSLINGQGINPNEHMQVRYQEPGGAHTLATADVDALFATGLAQTLDALITLPRTQVVFVDQAPEFPFTPLNCVRIGLFVDTSAQCVVDQTPHPSAFCTLPPSCRYRARDTPHCRTL